MSFLKSYYNSVSSYVIGIGDMDHHEEKDIGKENIDEVHIDESKSENWISGLYYDVYNNGGEIWKAMKLDLGEFANVLSKDTKVAEDKTAKGVKSCPLGDETDEAKKRSDYSMLSSSKLKSTINRFLDQVSKTLYIPPDSDDDDFYLNNFHSESQTICNRIEARICNLQTDQSTFTSDPTSAEFDEDLGDFKEWKDTLNMDDFQVTIAELVKHNQALLDHFTVLVPDTVSFDEFWARYFYRVASVKADESRREALKLRVSQEANGGERKEYIEAQSEIMDLPCALVTTMSSVGSKVLPVSDTNEEASTYSINYMEPELIITESDDLIVVKHVDGDNTQRDFCPESEEGDDCAGWEDNDIDITEEELASAIRASENEVIDSQWEDCN